MTLNISSQSTVITIGSENWSAWLESLTVGYEEYSVGSGLVRATGLLNLVFPANYAGIPSNPEYRFNPTQWQRGQTLSIAVGGAFLPCSGQQLFILTPPQRPARVMDGIAKLSIQIGCKLALEYFPPEPNDDFAGITPNTPKERGTIINEVLATLGISGASVSISDYPIAYPLPKLEGNWLDFCGKLADSAGYYLRCNTSGAIVAEPILPDSGIAATHTIGVDESDWQPIGDVSEGLTEKLIVSGVNYKVEVTPNETEIEEIKPLSLIDPANAPVGWALVLAVSLRKKTETKKINDSEYQLIVTESIPLVLIDPITFATAGTRYFLANSLIERTTFYLDSSGNVYKTLFEKIQPLVIFDPDNAPVGGAGILAISEQTKTTWVKTSDRQWTKTLVKNLPLILIDPITFATAGTRYFLALAENITDPTDTSGPPQNIGFNQFRLQEEQLTSEVYAAQLALGNTRERQRTISVPFVVSQAQLSAYGRTFNKFLNGRAFGWRFATRLNTSLLPMQRVSVIDGTTGYILHTDAMQWAVSQTEALILFNGIEAGVYNVATPDEITLPVTFPIGRLTATLMGNWSSSIFEIAFNARLENSWGANINPLAQLVRLTNSWSSAVGLSTLARLDNEWSSSITESSDLNAAIVAYWNFDVVDNIEWSSGNFADFVVNEINPSDLSYALAEGFGDAINLGTGLISNAMIPTSSCQVTSDRGGNPILGQPTLNGFDFVGVGLWIGSTITDPELWDGGSSQLPVWEFSQYLIEISLSDPSDVTMELVIKVSGSSVITEAIATGADINNRWDLILLEVDPIAETLNLSINGSSMTSYAYTVPTDTDGFILRNQSADDDTSVYSHSTDESFVYNRPLTSGEIATIYNSGSGVTYPFP